MRTREVRRMLHATTPTHLEPVDWERVQRKARRVTTLKRGAAVTAAVVLVKLATAAMT